GGHLQFAGLPPCKSIQAHLNRGRSRMAGDQRPLDAAVWFESLGRLLERVPSAAPLENRLRLSFTLVSLAPHPISRVVHCQLDESAFENLLDTGEFAKAAIALLGTLLSHEVQVRAQG